MKPSEVAELWARYKSFEKQANALLKEEIDKCGYAPRRSAVRHHWDAKSTAFSEAAHDLYLWASEKDKDAIRKQATEGGYEYEKVNPNPPAVCVHVIDDEEEF